jgi:hypothetical protein
VVNLVKARQQRTRRLYNIRRQANDFYPFFGGLNLIDSPLSSQPGMCQNAINYEIGFEGGYKRIGGYEGSDGRPSTAEPAYFKLPFGADEKPTYEDATFGGEKTWPLDQGLVRGKTSGSMGVLVDTDQSGGYGENVLLYNMSFDSSEWDLAAGITGTITVDGSAVRGYIWEGGNRTLDYLPLIECSAGTTYQAQALNNPISCATGDILYLSMLFRYLDNTGHQTPIKEIRFTVDNAVGDPFGLPSSTPTVDFDLDNAVVSTKTDHFQAAGVTILSDGVMRVWARTKICTTADATMGMSWHVLNGVNQARVWGGAPMAVVWKKRTSPHNANDGLDLDNTTYWSQYGLTSVTDGGGAWTSGIYPSFTRITEDTSGAWHRIETNVTGVIPTWMRFCKGDKLYIEFYAQFTSGQREGIYVTNLSGSTDTGWDDHASFGAGWNLNSGQTATLDGVTYSHIESHTIEQVSTDVYKCTMTTDAFEHNWCADIEIGLAAEIGAGDVDTFYTGTSKYLDITGLRVVVMPSGGAEANLAEVVTTDATKFVNTGALILAGDSAGGFQRGEELEAIDRWVQGLAGPDLDYELHTRFGTAAGKSVLDGEAGSVLDAQYLAAAQAVAGTGPTDGRAGSGNPNEIGTPTPKKPPGSGPVRGVCFYNGFVLAFRDNGEGTEGRLWKSSGVGWRRIDNNMLTVGFDAGTGAKPSPGDYVEDSSTNKTGYVIYVQTDSGTWGTDAAGSIYVKIDDPTDTAIFTNNNAIGIVGGSNFATIDGDGAAMTLAPGGRYEFRADNLYGHTNRERLYWVSGEDTGYEYYDLYEGFAPVITSMAVDKPNHLAIHNGHLFFSFPGGSVQLSGDGDPHSWTVITGASEIGVGDEITGFNEEVGNSLFIFTRDSSFVLQGNTRANFSLDDFNINAGAHEWSVQRIGLGMFFDDRGFTSMLQTQRSGSVNFQENAQSSLIQPLVEDLVRTTEVRASHLIKDENIYRCYFADGRIVSIGFDQHKVAGHMPLQYPFIVNVAFSGEDVTGAERIFAGTDDGDVYELEKGNSFDGEDIHAFMRTVLYHSKSPGRMKKYSHARVDGTFFGALTLSGQVEYDFGDPDWNLGAELDFSTDSAGGYWDDFTWDSFLWDKTKAGNPQEKLEGEGTNAAIYLHSTSSSDATHTLRGITLQWTPRRDDRRT